MTEGFAILCGNANRTLAEKVADAAGMALSDALVERFRDGEVSVEICTSVRDKDVFFIESAAPPVNDHSDRTAGDGRCVPTGVSRAHFRGDAVFRIRAVRQTARSSRADQRTADRRPVVDRRY